MSKPKKIALTQIFILILGIVAFSYAIGSNIKEVSALDPGSEIVEQAVAYEKSESLKELYGLIPSSASTIDIPVKAIPSLVEGTAGEEAVSELIGSTIASTRNPSFSAITKSWDFFQNKILSNTAYMGTIISSAAFIISFSKTGDLEQAAISAGKAAVSYGAYQVGKWAASELLGVSGIFGGLIGMGAAMAIGFLLNALLSGDTDYEVVTFNCYPWSAPEGGDDCEKCNEFEDLTCSEYQCRSLGENCELINVGTTEQRCIYVDNTDLEYPIIEAWDDVLPEGYIYNPDDAISPPDEGVRIVNTNNGEGCVGAFESFSFGISLNENAECKLDIEQKADYDSMDFYFSEGIKKKEHEYTLMFPGIDNLEAENITLENGGEFRIYVRCKDQKGNDNPANFVFSYCVDDGPDTTEPAIEDMSLKDETPISYGQTESPITIYTNEPAKCKWSHEDKSFENMENEMDCSENIFDTGSSSLYYECSGTLNGLLDKTDNQFYFRCNDSAGNMNKQSAELTLIGTQPLVINEVQPNETIVKGASDVIKVELSVETSLGYNQGESTCYYKKSDKSDSYYISFSETGKSEHSHNLWVDAGEYSFDIRCIDLGGNFDTKTIEFTAEIDTSAPLVIRAYEDDGYLKIITDEEAECVYDINDCEYDFEEATKMNHYEETENYVSWDTKKTYYIKCKDIYENVPLPNSCSIIAKPSNDY